MKTEPILIICGALGGLITATITLLVAFGIDVTAGQTAAILGIAAIIVQVVAAISGRSLVTPVAGLPPATRKRLENGQITFRLVLAVLGAALAVLALLAASGSKPIILLAVAIIALAAAIAAAA